MNEPENRKDYRRQSLSKNTKKEKISEEQRFLSKSKKQKKQEIEEIREEEIWEDWEDWKGQK
jgi:hypothetical protein